MNTSQLSKRKATTCAILVAALIAIPQIALAQAPAGGGGGLFGTGDNFANNLLAFLNGGFARTVATIGVIIIGLMAMTGRLELKKAGVVVFGIILIFAAAAIVEGIAGAV